MNKRILYINESLNTGSTGHIVEEIASSAMKNGYECMVAHGARYVHASQILHYAFSSRIEEYAHGVYSLFCNAHGLGSESATKRLIRFIQDWQPSLIHLHNIHGYYLNYPHLFEYLKKANLPVVWTLHDCWAITGRCAYFTLSGCHQWQTQCRDCPAYSDYPRSLLKAQTERNFLLKKQAFTGLNNMCITTVSNWLKEHVQQSFLQGYPCRTIYNGIDTEVFQPTASELRKQWNAEDKVVILGVASQWTETKGWKDWIRLAQRLDKNRYTVVMVGVSRRQQQELPDHCVVISKTDNRPQLAQVYSAADIYVNLAHQEAFGLTLLEAMACGTPCISYDNTAIPETTTQETAIILPDRDIDAVQRAIAQAGSEWKQQCSGECRNHVLNKFNNIDKIQEYLRLYGELTAMRS